MKNLTKIGLYVVLAVAAIMLGQRFYGSYNRLMADEGGPKDSDLTNVRVPDYQQKGGETKSSSKMGVFAAGFFFSVVALGILIARDVSQFIGQRTVKFLYNDEGEGLTDPEYERAEQAWADGNHLEAIELMRQYLRKNPQEQHAALRIAEIYEKDLFNYLAAALEYEEILTHKLAPERWGWTAIHLCNLYSKLNQPEKSVTLLRRIESEYSETAAAEKARKRLALFASGGERLDEESASVNEDTAAGPDQARSL